MLKKIILVMPFLFLCALPSRAQVTDTCSTAPCQVTLGWAQPIQVSGEAVASVQVTRNGTVLATVSPNVLSYTDANVASATYLYGVTNLDVVGNSASSTLSVNATPNVTPPPPPTCSGSNFFAASKNPVITDAKDTTPVSLGLILTAKVATQVCGIRWYKSLGTKATTHSYAVYSSAKAVLTSGTTSGETASGWQTQAFASPISVAAGATIVPTIFTIDYPDDQNYFKAPTAPITDASGTFTAPIGAGVYVEGPTTIAFPSNVFNASNYWIDVNFAAGVAPPPPPPSATVTTSGNVITLAPKNIPSGTSFTGTIIVDGIPLTFNGNTQ